jgi:hypothetical protein
VSFIWKSILILTASEWLKGATQRNRSMKKVRFLGWMSMLRRLRHPFGQLNSLKEFLWLNVRGVAVRGQLLAPDVTGQVARFQHSRFIASSAQGVMARENLNVHCAMALAKPKHGFAHLSGSKQPLYRNLYRRVAWLSLPSAAHWCKHLLESLTSYLLCLYHSTAICAQWSQHCFRC